MHNIIGIRREDKNQWERRSPLKPEHLKMLREEYQVTCYVQPSAKRIFTNEEYRSAGAIISDDLSSCDVLFGVKEMPIEVFARNKTYVFFSHTMKGQKQNMPMLKALMDKNCTLIDYEKITDDQGKRRIFFGPHAGMAGCIDSLWALGEKLEVLGIDNPFSIMNQAYRYKDMEEIESQLKIVAARIQEQGLPDSLVPFVVGIAGYGHVSRGARRILEHLPLIKIKASELETLKDRTNLSKHHIYRVVFEEKDMVELINPEESPGEFDVKDYFDNPARYKSIFNKYLPHMTLFINAIYWEDRYPRLMTRQDAENLWKNNQRKLLVVGDLTCDVEGSVEINTHVTDPGNPVYIYNPETHTVSENIDDPGFVVLAVDNLPSELPKPASEDFSKSLVQLLPDIINCDFRENFIHLRISEMIRRAIIVHRGVLTPRYQYLKEFLKDEG